MKICHISYSDAHGGAAKACYRTHLVIRKAGINSEIRTALLPQTEDDDVKSFCPNLYQQAYRKFVKVVTLGIIRLLQYSRNQVIQTLDIWPIIPVQKINKLDADIIHLHWVNYSMLSIKSIKRINKPIVWSFHDMWGFMGGEHYDDLSAPNRFKQPYSTKNKNVSGIDINRLIWKMKEKHWKDLDFTIIAPSKWMQENVRSSALLSGKKCIRIPYSISQDIFKIKDKKWARNRLNLSLKKQLILFAARDVRSHIKGSDLILEAIQILNLNDVEFVICGTSDREQISGVKTHHLGYISDENILADVYNACDVMLVPSRQDNLPNTVLESIACGVPVVGFQVGGLPDMVVHKYNGYLAQPFDTAEFANGIKYVLDNTEKINYRQNCLQHFADNFSQQVVSQQLIELYEELLSL